MDQQQQRQRRRGSRGSAGLGTIGVVASVAVAYGAYRLGFWAWNRWADDGEEQQQQQQQQQQMEQPLNHSRLSPAERRRLHSLRKRRVLRCREDVLSLVTTSFAAVLRQAVEDATDIGQSKRELKQLRSRRVVPEATTTTTRSAKDRSREAELWLRIQESTLTRMVASAYLHSLLFTILTVQVHLLGGYVFRSSVERTSLLPDTQLQITDHQDVLDQTYRQFVNHCVPSVLDAVRSAVSHAVDASPDWDVTNPSAALHMTLNKFENTINRIREQVEGFADQQPPLLQQFFVPSDFGNGVKEPTKNILNETWDLLESPAVQRAVNDCVAHVFEKTREQIWAPLFVNNEAEQAVAKVIAQLRDSSRSIFEKDCASSPMMSNLPSVLEVADISFS